MLHGRMAVNGASARSNDVVPALKAEKNPLLDLPQDLVAAAVHDVLKSSVLRCLDQDVGVHKIAGRLFARMTPIVLLPEPGMPIRMMLDSLTYVSALSKRSPKGRQYTIWC